ncbi:MAG: PqqD family protein [Candidatus Syntropharchaeia archaeon]
MEKPKLKKSVAIEEKSSYITRESEIGLMLLDSKNNRIFEVNETGSVIVKLCDGEHTRDDIVNELCKSYKVDREELEKDVDEFLKKMEEYKLIK